MNEYVSGNPLIKDEDVGEIAAFIAKEFGGFVTKEQFLEAATPPTSPMHRHFEWDDKAAAHKHRLHQAQKLITCVCIKRPENEPPIRSYHYVRLDDGGKTYADNETVKAHESLYKQVLEKAKGELTAWRSRFHRYEEFFDIIAEIDKLSTEVVYGKEREGIPERGKSDKDRGATDSQAGRKNHDPSVSRLAIGRQQDVGKSKTRDGRQAAREGERQEGVS